MSQKRSATPPRRDQRAKKSKTDRTFTDSALNDEFSDKDDPSEDGTSVSVEFDRADIGSDAEPDSESDKDDLEAEASSEDDEDHKESPQTRLPRRPGPKTGSRNRKMVALRAPPRASKVAGELGVTQYRNAQTRGKALERTRPLMTEEEVADLFRPGKSKCDGSWTESMEKELHRAFKNSDMFKDFMSRKSTNTLRQMAKITTVWKACLRYHQRSPFEVISPAKGVAYSGAHRYGKEFDSVLLWSPIFCNYLHMLINHSLFRNKRGLERLSNFIMITAALRTGDERSFRLERTARCSVMDQIIETVALHSPADNLRKRIQRIVKADDASPDGLPMSTDAMLIHHLTRTIEINTTEVDQGLSGRNDENGDPLKIVTQRSLRISIEAIDCFLVDGQPLFLPVDQSHEISRSIIKPRVVPKRSEDAATVHAYGYLAELRRRERSRAMAQEGSLFVDADQGSNQGGIDAGHHGRLSDAASSDAPTVRSMPSSDSAQMEQYAPRSTTAASERREPSLPMRSKSNSLAPTESSLPAAPGRRVPETALPVPEAVEEPVHEKPAGLSFGESSLASHSTMPKTASPVPVAAEGPVNELEFCLSVAMKSWTPDMASGGCSAKCPSHPTRSDDKCSWIKVVMEGGSRVLSIRQRKRN